MLGPPFQIQLQWGLRFVQAAVLLPLYRRGEGRARALPVRFSSAPAPRRPKKKAVPEEWKQYRQAQAARGVSARFVAQAQGLHRDLGRAGVKAKVMVLAADGSFCNRRVFGAAWDRTTIVARARKDAVFCFPAAAASRRFYAAETFTPEQVRQNESIPWQKTRVYFGGKRRTLRYKLVSGVLWRGGARRCKLRLLVVAPTPYRNRKRGRWLYRRAAYLLTSELEATAPRLLQIYLDRWQIEVNHREEKDTLGVGQAQVWNEKAVPRQPASMVAAGVQRFVAGQPASLRTAPRPSLRRVAEVAPKATTALVPRSGDAAAPTSLRTASLATPVRHPGQLPTLDTCRRLLRYVQTPEGRLDGPFHLALQ